MAKRQAQFLKFLNVDECKYQSTSPQCLNYHLTHIPIFVPQENVLPLSLNSCEVSSF